MAAATRLLETCGAADVSCRDIAAEAGVNHGLIHRYFGSKDALVREAIERTNARVSAEFPLERPTTWVFSLLRERPEFARILARCCLDGPTDLLAAAAPPPDRVERHAAQIAAGLERLGLGGRFDPYVLNALGVAALLGWTLFKPLLVAGYRVPPDADERLAEVIAMIDMVLLSST